MKARVTVYSLTKYLDMHVEANSESTNAQLQKVLTRK